MKISTKFVTVLIVSALGMSMAYAQGGGGGQRGGGQGRGQFGRGNNFGELQLLQRKDVQKDLGLTEDQTTKITDYAAKQRGAGRQGGGGAGGNGGGGGQRQGGGGAGGGALTDEQRAAMAKAAAERREKTRKDLLEIVSEAQLKRVDEIGIQLQGNSAITNAEVQKALGLSEDQIAKIKELQTKQQEANRALGQKVQSGELTREDMTAAFQKNNETMKAELGKILTSAQADKLKAMGGKTFTPDAPGN